MTPALKVFSSSSAWVVLLLGPLMAGQTYAQAPTGYYDTADPSGTASLRGTLHEIIDDHTRFPYTSASTDTWDILEIADEDPGAAGNVLDLYMNASYAKVGGGNSDYNREHVWPKSYGFPKDGSSNYAYTDCHHLHIADSGYNSARSNRPFRNCSSGCSEYTTLANRGAGGGNGAYPGNSNWGAGQFSAGSWETWAGKRGDVARSMFYMDVRYEGGSHGGTGFSEPDLILTDDPSLIVSNSQSNLAVAHMGMLAVLLQWHIEDPVDDLERNRHEVVYSFQGNRNPFVDHPEWVTCVFQSSCVGTPPLLAPTGMTIATTVTSLDIDWSNVSGADIAGYNIFRSGQSGGPYVQQNISVLPLSAYSDTAVIGGDTFYYVATTVAGSGQQSVFSAQVSATVPGGGGSGEPWINEFHYDNNGGDTGEFVEIAGPAGLSLVGFTVQGYNGNDGGLYKTVALSGALPDQGGCGGTLAFDFTGLQNGAADGIALVDASGAVVEFLSYEGTLTATSGAAAGMTSTSVGVAESGSTPVGSALQLSGTGATAMDFGWESPSPNSRGLENPGQTLALCGGGNGGCTDDGQCNDDLFCNGVEVCDVATGICGAGIAVDCDDGIACTVDNCDDIGGICDHAPSDAVCDNGLVCDGAEICSPALGCQAGPALDCDDNIACTLDQCSETAGGCGHTPDDSLCDNGSFCDGSETCSATSDCQAGAAPCTGGSCDEAAEVCVAAPATTAWINEIHYDNGGRDRSEGFEIAGPAATDLDGWLVVLYNGQGGGAYAVIDLGGTLADQQNGFGARWTAHSSIQNGAADGIALVDPSGSVVEFLSYEGVLTAADGPAAGMQSTDIGVRESSGTSENHSLQLQGSGAAATDFVWAAPQPFSHGSINAGQTMRP